jgi:hypothetical protein
VAILCSEFLGRTTGAKGEEQKELYDLIKNTEYNFSIISRQGYPNTEIDAMEKLTFMPRVRIRDPGVLWDPEKNNLQELEMYSINIRNCWIRAMKAIEGNRKPMNLNQNNKVEHQSSKPNKANDMDECANDQCGWVGSNEDKEKVLDESITGSIEVVVLTCPVCGSDEFHDTKTHN